VYGAERADHRALEQLEAVLREVAEELATWRARALKAEGDGKGGGPARGAGEGESRQLRTRVDAARTRVQALVSRLAFLEEQARETGGSSDAAAGGGSR
jgi:cell division protein FtsB